MRTACQIRDDERRADRIRVEADARFASALEDIDTSLICRKLAAVLAELRDGPRLTRAAARRVELMSGELERRGVVHLCSAVLRE